MADLMDWYCGTNVTEDLTVPTNNEEDMLDRLPSPDSWSSWGKLVETCSPPEKLAVFSGDVERHNTSPRQLPRLQTGYLQARSDDPLVSDDAADDIFFRSLFETGASNVVELVPSTSCAQIPQSMEPEFEFCVSEDRSNMPEEDVLDESVLLDLQRTTLQLAKKTRIHFRDSLYRLAENSRHQQAARKENLENWKLAASNIGSFRLQEYEAEISDANTIDRTVATFLFNTMTCCRAPLPRTEYDDNNSSDLYVCSAPGGDAEVPTFVDW